ncbi:unnamed protein product [Nippostrongylus brasiliensis]|uniref:Transthyretin-like family protein n=1 Tax=Nippostrongylus brasiliensis TaxID=27835 RepID=A0A0N4YKH2_NIPBR|nr:unnamed protein product [Nippostrongylus brasiliensis]
MLFLSLLSIVGVVSASTECVWAMGKLACNKNQTRVKNAIVELPFVDLLFPDDKAGMSMVDEEDGIFKVEGCASDFDWLGPLLKNPPEFYFKIRHSCNGDKEEEKTVYPPDMKVFVPLTMDHFMDHPIELDDFY